MNEVNLLMAVTAVVVAGLAAWVFVVRRTAKQAWAEPQNADGRETRP